MTTLSTALAEYLALRRSLGYKLERPARVLTEFVDYLDQAGANHVTIDLALGWAVLPANPDSGWRAQRLGMVRTFARWLQTIDPDTEIPPSRLLHRSRRPAPYLYSETEIAALMAAARQLASPLRAATLETVIGTLAATGLRVAEVIRLDRSDVDVDERLLMVRDSKLGKSRFVPLHPSTVDALRDYKTRRDQHFPNPRSAAWFISTRGTRLLSSNLGALFAEVIAHAGLPALQRRPRPRLGDLRHTFACRVLEEWHRAGIDVQANLPVLSTYLGHVSPRSTYWYLSADPQLLAAAAERRDKTLAVTQ
jgi:integrase/recombinase XerD